MRVRLAGCQKTDYLRADYIAAHASATYTEAGSSPHGSVDVCGSISGVNLTIKPGGPSAKILIAPVTHITRCPPIFL